MPPKNSQEYKDLHDKAFKLAAQLKAVEEGRDILLWREGEILLQLKENKAYRYVWGDEEGQTWNSFLSELGIPEPTASYKISLYRKWIKELNFEPLQLRGIHTRKLQRANTRVTKENAPEILDLARNLSFGDYLIELKEKYPLSESELPELTDFKTE